MMQARHHEAGITLVEMLVALMIFALVALASFTTLDTILRVRERTDGRLEHLAKLDRALQVFGRDVAQSDPLEVKLEDNVLRTTQTTGRALRTYLVADQTLQRENRFESADVPLVQSLMGNVSGISFRVLGEDREWRDIWPDPAEPMPAMAVDMVVTLTDGKTLKRLVLLVQVVPE
jgi:general secretion pathway protein J